MSIIVLLAAYGVSITCSSRASLFLSGFLHEKYVVVIGEMLKIINLVFILIGSQPNHANFLILLLGQIIGGCGFSIAISTDSSILRKITEEDTSNALFGSVQARSQGQMFMATLIAGTIGSVLYNNRVDWPFFASLVANTLAIIAIGAIACKKHEIFSDTTKMLDASGDICLGPARRSWILFYAVSRAFALAPFVGFIPYFFVMIGVDQILFGIILGTFTICGFIAAMTSIGILRRYGVHVLGALTILCMVGSISLYGFSSVIAGYGIDYIFTGIAGIAFLGFASGGIRPVTMQNLNIMALTSSQRASVFPRMEKEYGIWNAILMFVGGYMMSVVGFLAMMQCLAFAYLIVISFLLLRNYSKMGGM